MEVTQNPLDWTSDDVLNWQKFLTSQTGSRLIPRVLEFIPDLLAKGDINEILIRSGEVRGWRSCIHQLIFLTSVVEAKTFPNTPPNFPPLDEDLAWSGLSGMAGEPINPQNS